MADISDESKEFVRDVRVNSKDSLDNDTRNEGQILIGELRNLSPDMRSVITKLENAIDKKMKADGLSPADPEYDNKRSDMLIRQTVNMERDHQKNEKARAADPEKDDGLSRAERLDQRATKIDEAADKTIKGNNHFARAAGPSAAPVNGNMFKQYVQSLASKATDFGHKLTGREQKEMAQQGMATVLADIKKQVGLAPNDLVSDAAIAQNMRESGINVDGITSKDGKKGMDAAVSHFKDLIALTGNNGALESPNQEKASGAGKSEQMKLLSEMNMYKNNPAKYAALQERLIKSFDENKDGKTTLAETQRGLGNLNAEVLANTNLTRATKVAGGAPGETERVANKSGQSLLTQMEAIQQAAEQYAMNNPNASVKLAAADVPKDQAVAGKFGEMNTTKATIPNEAPAPSAGRGGGGSFV